MEDSEEDRVIRIESGEIRKVYEYVGQMVSSSVGVENELKQKRGKAWNKFWSLQKVFESRPSIKTK